MLEEVNIYLCEKRSFCFGVVNAIEIVKKALKEFGVPIYVLHEIVHNKHVVSNLEEQGVIFIDDMNKVDKKRPLIFSAHGTTKELIETAKNQNISYIDATCPLVKKVHNKIVELENADYKIIVIGSKNHQEIIGTIGQLKNPKDVYIINSPAEANELDIPFDEKVGFVTQTTLSVDDTAQIISILKEKFRNIESLSKSDICLATTERQNGVRKIAQNVDLMIVIGSRNSSNSQKLKETAINNGTKKAILIDDEKELDMKELNGVKNIGITAGASAPEYLVEEVLNKLRSHYKKINIQSI